MLKNNKDLALAIIKAIKLNEYHNTISLHNACRESVSGLDADYKAVYLMLRNCQSDALKWAEKIIKNQ